MEVMNENHIPQEPRRRNEDGVSTNRGSYLFLGVLLIAIGMVWLFHNFGLIGPRLFDVLFSWQMLMVIVGGYLIAVRQYTAGIIVGGLGLIFLMVDIFDIHLSFTKVILPSLVIAAGAYMLISRLGKNR